MSDSTEKKGVQSEQYNSVQSEQYSVQFFAQFVHKWVQVETDAGDVISGFLAAADPISQR